MYYKFYHNENYMSRNKYQLHNFPLTIQYILLYNYLRS